MAPICKFKTVGHLARVCRRLTATSKGEEIRGLLQRASSTIEPTCSGRRWTIVDGSRLVVQVETRPFRLQNYCQKWVTGSTRQACFSVQRGARPCKGAHC